MALKGKLNTWKDWLQIKWISSTVVHLILYAKTIPYIVFKFKILQVFWKPWLSSRLFIGKRKSKMEKPIPDRRNSERVFNAFWFSWNYLYLFNSNRFHSQIRKCSPKQIKFHAFHVFFLNICGKINYSGNHNQNLKIEKSFEILLNTFLLLVGLLWDLSFTRCGWKEGLKVCSHWAIMLWSP